MMDESSITSDPPWTVDCESMGPKRDMQDPQKITSLTESPLPLSRLLASDRWPDNRVDPLTDASHEAIKFPVEMERP